MPQVQNWAGKKVVYYVNDTYGTSITAQKLLVKLNGQVELKGVYIADHKDDTLVYAKAISTSIQNFDRLRKGDLDLGTVMFYDPVVNVKVYEGESRDNISIFAKKFASKSKKKNKKDTFELVSTRLILKNGVFSYVDENLKRPDLVYFNNLNLEVLDFNVIDDAVAGTIKRLSFKAGNNFRVSNLEGQFMYTPQFIKLNDFIAKTAYSEIKGSISLDTSNGALKDFNNLVKVNCKLSRSVVSTNDIRPFYEGIGKNINLFIAGDFSGTLNRLSSNNLAINALSNSAVRGEVELSNIMSASDFQIDGDYRSITSNYEDLVRLLPRDLGVLPERFKHLQDIVLSGPIKVTRTAVIADVNGNTGLGDIEADLTLENLNLGKGSSYFGEVHLMDFDLGLITGESKLGKTSLDVKVEGTGFIQEQLDTKVSGAITQINYNGYTYRDATVFGSLKTPVFDGELMVNDSKLKMHLNGLVNVSKQKNIYDFTANIKHANLYTLGIDTDEASVLSGNVTIDGEGLTVDDAVGTVSFDDTVLTNSISTYRFEDFEINSSLSATDVRRIVVNSPDIIYGEMEGKFKFKEMVPLFKNAVSSLYSNYKPKVVTEGQYLDFDFKINNKIVEVFIPDVSLEPETIIKGKIVASEGLFKMVFKSPQIKAFGTTSEDVEIRVDNKNKFFNTYVAADYLAVNGYEVNDFSLINVTLKDTLFLRSEFKGGKNNLDVFNIDAYHSFDTQGNAVLGFKKSDIKFKGNQWYINAQDDKKHRIVFDTDFNDFVFDDLSFTHKNESVLLNGVITDSTYKKIDVKFDNVSIEKVTPEIPGFKFNGTVNGAVNLVQQGGSILPASTLKIDSLSLNDVVLGDLVSEIKGNNSLTSYGIHAVLENQDINALQIDGLVDVSKNGAIDVAIASEELNLSALAPLGQDIITNIRGLASGNVNVTGLNSDPEFNGNLTIDNGGLKIPYLNVDYAFDEATVIDLSTTTFGLNNAQFTDVKHKTRGAIDGTINHELFDKWLLDLSINADRLLVLDTEAQEDALYYGTGFIEGGATIKGAADQLKISVFGTTSSGTVFNIPLQDSETLGDNSFIHFLTPEEKSIREEGVFIAQQNSGGLELEFDLDITEDAVVEIVIDEQFGSTLRGVGVGTIFIELDTNDKFNMWGDYSTRKGGVLNYKYGGILTKVFEVKEEGSIQWNGDPLGAILDIQASYKANANPAIMLENPTINQRIPVDVIIKMEGELAKPEINFDLNYPNAASTVAAELEYRLSDRDTRELNAISLVSQNTFINPNAVNSGSGVTTAGALNNLYETGAALLSDLLFNKNDGLFDVGLNLVQAENNPDYQSAGEVGLTLSTQIANRVLINGKVGVPTGGVSQSLIVGDVEVDFLLNENGTLRATVFNRQSDFQFLGEAIGYTQGGGLSYAVDFDSFKDILQKLSKKKNKEAQSKLKSAAKKTTPDGIDGFIND